MNELRKQRTQKQPLWAKVLASIMMALGIAVVLIGLIWAVIAMADAAFAEPLPVLAKPPAATAVAKPSLKDEGAMRLASFGYVVNTPARLDKAIRHWQRANHLVVDGIIGTQTLTSLRGAAVPTQSAKRVSPPAPAAVVLSRGDVEAIIRDVWSGETADVIDWAVGIAKRESSLVPTAANSCCYGLFQIYFQAHKAWLSDYGVTKYQDLFDPRTNAIVALALYHQAGTEPWKLI